MSPLSLRVVLIVLSALFSSGCCKLISFGSNNGQSGSSSSNDRGKARRQASRGTEIGFTRPALAVQRGQFFTWAMPAEWQATETGNGVDLISPDGNLAASSILLTGSRGQTTPWEFVVLLLGRLGATDINQISAQDLPPAPSGYPGINWEIQEFELTFTDKKGVSQHADMSCGILNAYGGYSVVMQMFSAAENEFDQARTWLPLLPQSVTAIDPGNIAYQKQLIPVRNRPLDNSGLMESWERKNLSQDRISRAQRKGMMGYEPMVSPTTGRNYNMPLESYDGTVGGYRNPDHPDEILRPAEP